jgi:transposase
MLHRVRLILSRQRTQLSNALRAHLAEFGIVAPAGRNGIDRLLQLLADNDERVPADARVCLEMLAAQLRVVKEQILENDRRIMARARETELGRRLMEIPSVGPLLASAFVATVADPAIFRSGRNLAAWIGLVPRQNSSGGKERLGGISKAGNRYLRQMLIVGAMAVVRYAERNGAKRPSARNWSGPAPREWHYGQRHHAPRKQVGHMAAPTSTAKLTNALANGEPSTQGRTRTFSTCHHGSAH